jgi:chemotaxis protein histidine kinase CheA
LSDPIKLVQEQLARLAKGYASELPKRISGTETALQEFLAAPIASETMDRLRRHVHQLKGSGTTFGFDDITRVACVFEAVLDALSRQAVPPNPQQRAQLNRLTAELRTLAEQARHSAGDPS